MLSVKVDVRGPVFDGRAARAVDAYVEEAKAEVARVGKNDVLVRLGQVLRDPTPYYETRIRTDRVGADWHIWDGPSTFKYGPWLEGTGSRNSPVTRFGGYWTFKTVAARLNAGRAKQVAQRVLPRFLARMRG